MATATSYRSPPMALTPTAWTSTTPTSPQTARTSSHQPSQQPSTIGRLTGSLNTGCSGYWTVWSLPLPVWTACQHGSCVSVLRCLVELWQTLSTCQSVRLLCWRSGNGRESVQCQRHQIRNTGATSARYPSLPSCLASLRRSLCVTSYIRRVCFNKGVTNRIRYT